jgi:ammonia channel protein AmtB
MPIDTGDTSWMLICTGLVMLMTPALGFFEAGLIRSKNSLSVIMQTFPVWRYYQYFGSLLALHSFMPHHLVVLYIIHHIYGERTG